MTRGWPQALERRKTPGRQNQPFLAQHRNRNQANRNSDFNAFRLPLQVEFESLSFESRAAGPANAAWALPVAVVSAQSLT
jgi:hypothetical protein